MNPRRVLFIAEGQLGDLLLLTPALRAMKETYPSSSISVLIIQRRQSSLSNTGTALLSRQSNGVYTMNRSVDSVYVLNRQVLRSLRGWKRVVAEWSVVEFLRHQSPDTVICTFPQDRFTVLALASGATSRVGQRGQSLSWMLTHRVDSNARERGVLEHYCNLVRAVGAKVTSLHTEYTVSAPARAWADEFLREHELANSRILIAVHPGATGDYKIWPPDRYAALIGELQSREHTRVVVCQGVLDKEIVNAIRTSLGSDVVTAEVGDTDQLAAILQRCTLCVSNDSGPRHLAIATGVPSLAFFRKYHDKEWKVYDESDRAATLQGNEHCSLCPEGACLDRIPDGERFGCECLRMISVQLAVEKALQCLQHAKANS